MAKKDAGTDEAQERKAGRTGGAKQLLLAGALLAGLMMGSAGAAVVAASILIRPQTSDKAPDEAKSDTAEQASAESKTEPTPTVEEGKTGSNPDIDKPTFTFENPLIVNVKETSLRRFLRCRPVFVMADEKAKEKIASLEVELRDLLIPLLKSKTMNQLDEANITQDISREIMEAVNGKLRLEKELIDVKIPEFVVQ